jgi:dipeptidyl aminopeptidase/acylaminoacyl peptidase
MIPAILAAATVGVLLQTPPPPSNSQPPASDTARSVTVRQISYAQIDGTRNAATLVTPADSGSGAQGRPVAATHPAILYLHWYEPPRPSSNRTEFLPEAVELAASGVVSLLIDTPWRGETWFPTRDASRDYEFTVEMTKNVRRGLDVLLAQPGIDPSRVAIVGHDFGAMWGALAAADDPRVTHLVFMAGTAAFSDWYLFSPKREGAEKDAFVAKLAPLAPAKALVRVSPRPMLLQFGTKDKFVTNEDAATMAQAVPGPKTVKTYDVEHELSYQARVDRLAWLRDALRLK